MNSVNGSGFAAKPARLWQVAILTAAGAIGATSQADAAFYYWTDYSDGSYYARQDRHPEIPRQKPQKRSATGKKEVVAEKEAGTKPQGPLVIVVSIERQRVTVYDSNGVFAESPVSTGMKGHSTPMGVFSVIQKHKFHHSNIYSGAPMPYMQRITWSGVAMHAGVLPGYPASHGCIRMPISFAMKMWNWTKMGARVIVAPGEMTPHSFSHPLLASTRVPPQPAASLEPQSNVGDKADKGAADTKAAETKPIETKPIETKTASADGVLELRASVGHTVMSDVTTGNAAAHEEAAASTDKIESPAKSETKTAEASDAANPAQADKLEAAKTEPARPEAAQSEPAKTEAAKSETAKSESAKPDAAKTEAAEAAKKPAAPALATAPESKKDESRLAEPAPAAKPEAPKRAGQIAVFISRKDSKLYVRQNFAPLFEVPVTIATSDRPLGTHIFTAELDKTDSNALRWSVVSLPVSARSAAREDDNRLTRRKGGAVVIPVAAKPVVAKPVVTPDSPAAALDRISIPADTLAKINEMLTSGGSIIISDQGINQGETGEGTDFIVRLY
ncbi:L,D-transpeptidase family protein [Bradyrhizobium sp. Y36]|uniref:L,D-transpeptidase family protein n=1 Tax=Bradyrhizobium sp. Y36 TaxID=2035447 RepID=UPI0018E9BEDC|nr:L,D-transpeptidase family protein [Bradyrhizobium sp. Y36]